MGAGLIGGIGTGISTAIQTKLALDEAKRSRNWQKMMSDTAYQRGMRDLRKAGLNPILAGRFGGATTPTGSAASLPAPADFAGSAQKVAGMQNLQQDTLLKTSQRFKETELASLASEQATRTRAERYMIEAQLPGARNMSEYMRTDVGKGAQWWSAFMRHAAGPLNFGGNISWKPGK